MKSHLWVAITLLFLSLISGMVKAAEVEETQPIEVAQAFPVEMPRPVVEMPLNIVERNLQLVFNTCKDMGVEQHSETMQAILMQESSGGDGLFKGGRSVPSRNYGMMQIRVETARVLFRDNPDLLARYFGDRELSDIKDKEIKDLLIHNNEASVRLAVTLFKQYWEIAKGDWIKTVAGYNMGIFKAIDGRNVKINPYAKGVYKYIQAKVHPYNQQVGLLIDTPDWTKVSFAVNNNKGAKHGKSKQTSTTNQGEERSSQRRRASQVQVVASNDHPGHEKD